MNTRVFMVVLMIIIALIFIPAFATFIIAVVSFIIQAICLMLVANLIIAGIVTLLGFACGIETEEQTYKYQ